MFEALFRNKFTDELMLYCCYLLLLLISPFCVIWELIHTFCSCFRCRENLSGKVVLITGASSGIGEQLAYEYARRGARLAIISTNKPESPLKIVADKARQLGSPDVLYMFADVSKVDECRMFIDATVNYFGHLDHLVCNAGIGPAYSTDMDVTKFVSVMDINFWGSVYPTQFAIPHLKKTNGKIIVNSSCSGVCNPPRHGVYNASKAALISFYESLGHELFPTITITILTLGFIQTQLITAKYSMDGVGGHLKKDLGDVLLAMEAEPCAKAIVDGVCKGATAITEPRFIKGFILLKFLFPQLHSLYLRTFSVRILKV